MFGSFNLPLKSNLELDSYQMRNQVCMLLIIIMLHEFVHANLDGIFGFTITCLLFDNGGDH